MFVEIIATWNLEIADFVIDWLSFINNYVPPSRGNKNILVGSLRYI